MMKMIKIVSALTLVVILTGCGEEDSSNSQPNFKKISQEFTESSKKSNGVNELDGKWIRKGFHTIISDDDDDDDDNDVAKCTNFIIIKGLSLQRTEQCFYISPPQLKESESNTYSIITIGNKNQDNTEIDILNVQETIENKDGIIKDLSLTPYYISPSETLGNVINKKILKGLFQINDKSGDLKILIDDPRNTKWTSSPTDNNSIRPTSLNSQNGVQAYSKIGDISF